MEQSRNLHHLLRMSKPFNKFWQVKLLVKKMRISTLKFLITSPDLCPGFG